MLPAVRRITTAAGVAAAIGALAVASAYHVRSLGDAQRVGGVYARHAIGRPFTIAFAILAALGFAAALVVEKLPRKPRRTHGAVKPPSPIEAMDADVLREILANLAAKLRPLVDQPLPDVIRFVDLLLEGAIRVGASDIHLHPLDAATSVSFRVQGILEDVLPFPAAHHRQLVSRLKVMGELNTFRSDRPQDGHFQTSAGGATADVRISVLPTNHGEKVVLRIANVGMQVPDLGAIGFPPELGARYQRILAKPQGVVFLTGPTGSGKTTTIYASLGHVKRSRGETTQIATIEDPVEFDVPFLTQTQVKAEVGLTFAQGLRSILRQDPNVIMVGEIRDPETAHIAIQAGLTGHQIVTTVHADSAAGAFNRIIEMGVEPFLVASASLASVSQRLVRALCPHCRVAAPPTIDEVTRLAQMGIADRKFFTSPGCEKCGGAGYLGRRAIFELLEMTPQIRDLINGKVPTARIHDAAVAEGMVPLVDAALALARSGVTSVREVFRVVG